MLSATQARKALRFNEARRLFESALRQAERFGENDPRLTTSLRDLADLYLDKKEYAKAEPLYLRELKILETFGNNYPDIAHDLFSLGRIYSARHDYTKADKYYRRAVVPIEEEFPQANAREQYILYSDLAENCKNLKNYSDAEIYYNKMLASGRVFAPGRPEMAEDLVRVAENYENLGKFEEAANFYQRAAAQFEKIYGVSGGSVTALCQLAHVRLRQKNFGEADKVADQIHKAALKLRGKQQVVLSTHIADLGSQFADAGRYSQAETVYKAAILVAPRDTTIGQLDTGRTLLRLADVYSKQERWADAADYYQQLCSLYERTSGRNSIPYIHCISYLGSSRTNQKRYADAKVLFRSALSCAERLPTRNYLEVINALRCLATVAHEQKQFPEAEALFKRALDISKKNIGPNSSITADCLHDLGSVYLDQQKYNQVLPIYRRAVEIYLSQPDPATLNTSLMIETMNALSVIYLSENNYAAIEPLCRKAIELSKHFSTSREAYGRTLSIYEDLLRRTNRLNQADQIAAEARSLQEHEAATTYSRLAPQLNLCK